MQLVLMVGPKLVYFRVGEMAEPQLSVGIDVEDSPERLASQICDETGLFVHTSVCVLKSG